MGMRSGMVWRLKSDPHGGPGFRAKIIGKTGTAYAIWLHDHRREL